MRSEYRSSQTTETCCLCSKTAIRRSLSETHIGLANHLGKTSICCCPSKNKITKLNRGKEIAVY